MRYFLLFLLSFFLIDCKQVIGEPNRSENLEINTVFKKINDSDYHIYSWKEDYTIENKLVNRITVPDEYERQVYEKKSFADWLRNIPLKEGNPDVMLYNGSKKGNQNAQFAVLDIDVGTKDLQQCADAVMRLRAEYLFSTNQKEDIAFHFTSGDKCAYNNWSNGYRPKISGNKVNFSKTAQVDKSYKNFKKYMEIIFSYCGTFSLEKELKKVADLNDIKAGDVFIMGGFPGHAVTVMDVALNKQTKEKIFLLSQSYMPAQDIHILKNPSNKDLSPWFSVNFGENLNTPEWTFHKSALKSF